MVRCYGRGVDDTMTPVPFHGTAGKPKQWRYSGTVDSLACRLRVEPDQVQRLVKAMGVEIGEVGRIVLSREQFDQVSAKLTAQDHA